MVLHGLHQQLLALQIIGEHLVVFQICKELHIKKSHQKKECIQDTNVCRKSVYSVNIKSPLKGCSEMPVYLKSHEKVPSVFYV